MTKAEGRPGLGAVGLAAFGLELPAVPASVPTMRHRATAFAAAQGADSDLQGDVALAVTEAVTNAVKHAYNRQEPEGQVTLRASAQEHWLEFEISDQGNGFQEGESSGLGLGLQLMAKLSSDVKIIEGPTGTRVQIRFALDAPPERA